MGWSWKKMTEAVPEGRHGTAEVKHFDISDAESRMSTIRGGLSYVQPGRYAKLLVDGQIVMSDTRMEKVFSGEVVDKAHGSVLVAGLGLGMVIFPILEKKEVKMVTVVELNYDVIKLVKPRVKSPKLRIIHSDIAVWLPPKGEKYNTIFFDIWPTICQDNLQEVAILHQAFKNRLDRSDPECWMGSWCAHYLRGQRRKEKR